MEGGSEENWGFCGIKSRSEERKDIRVERKGTPNSHKD